MGHTQVKSAHNYEMPVWGSLTVSLFRKGCVVNGQHSQASDKRVRPPTLPLQTKHDLLAVALLTAAAKILVASGVLRGSHRVCNDTGVGGVQGRLLQIRFRG